MTWKSDCSSLTSSRTIHGMVYNAMKLFMEVDPQLFDDCSHEYTESQNNADQRSLKRQQVWDQIARQAKAQRNGRIDGRHDPHSAAETMHVLKTHTPVLTPIRSESTEQLGKENVSRGLDELQIRDGPAPARSQTQSQSQSQIQTSPPSQVHPSLQEP